MKVLELQSVKREDFGLYYRKNYTATAVMEIVAKTVHVPVSFVIVTYFHVLLGEQLPKCIALKHTEDIALMVSHPMDIFMTVLKPFVWFLQVSGDKILKIFKADQDDTETGE